jgi:hypothetical protein
MMTVPLSSTVSLTPDGGGGIFVEEFSKLRQRSEMRRV